MQHRKHSRSAGFTLIEIAIVLVIIGLLLGGVDFSNLFISLKGVAYTSLAEAQAAAMLAGAAGVLAQRQLLVAIGIDRFLQFEGNDACIAVRHRAERAGAVAGSAASIAVT